MKKLYLDANVVLDYLLKRSPFDVAAKELFATAELGGVQLLVSSLSFTLVHYIASKELRKTATLDGLASLFKLVRTVAIDERIIGQALQASLPDFEDAHTSASLGEAVTRANYPGEAVPRNSTTCA